MQFEVLKPFDWAGQSLQRGDTLEIPDESTKIGPLTRAKFIRFAGEVPPGNVHRKEPELPKVKEVAQEMEAEQRPQAHVSDDIVPVSATRDPREVVRQAKERAVASKGGRSAV